MQPANLMGFLALIGSTIFGCIGGGLISLKNYRAIITHVPVPELRKISDQEAALAATIGGAGIGTVLGFGVGLILC